MNKILNYNYELIEQITFSGFRYLFWISIPFFFSESLNFISKLTLINLLNITIYSTLIGTPSFYLLSKKGEKILKKSFLPINLVIVFTSFFSIITTHYFFNIPFFSKDFLIMGLFIYASSLSDWNRKVSILKKEVNFQSYKNMFSILLWLIYLLLVHFKFINYSYLFSACIFSLINIFVQLNYGYLTIRVHNSYKDIFETPKVLKQYLIVSIIAYLSGNLLFYFTESDSLNLFIVLRNYLTPITVLSLFIETHGAIEHQNKNKRKIFSNQFFIISAISIIIILFVGLFLYFISDFYDFYLYLFASITTFLVAIIKIPTVFLRLHNHDYLITKAYIFSLFFLVPILFFNNFFMYDGIEIITLSYVFIFTYLFYHLNKLFKIIQ